MLDASDVCQQWGDGQELLAAILPHAQQLQTRNRANHAAFQAALLSYFKAPLDRKVAQQVFYRDFLLLFLSMSEFL